MALALFSNIVIMANKTFYKSVDLTVYAYDNVIISNETKRMSLEINMGKKKGDIFLVVIK